MSATSVELRCNALEKECRRVGIKLSPTQKAVVKEICSQLESLQAGGGKTLILTLLQRSDT